MSYISEASSFCDNVVDGVARNPEHGGQGHDEADAVRPEGILHAAVLDRGPFDDVEDEDGLESIT